MIGCTGCIVGRAVVSTVGTPGVGRTTIGLCTSGTQCAKHSVTSLTKQEFLSLMGGTLWNHFSPLSCHQIQKLVDKKRGGQSRDPTPGNGDQFSAYRTAKLSGVPCESGHDPVQTVKANGV